VANEITQLNVSAIAAVSTTKLYITVSCGTGGTPTSCVSVSENAMASLDYTVSLLEGGITSISVRSASEIDELGESGGNGKTYTYTVTRAASANHGLVGLNLYGLDISQNQWIEPAFDGLNETIHAYTAEVINGVEVLTFYPVTAHLHATCTVTDGNITSVASSTLGAAFPLNGERFVLGFTSFTVEVAAQDGGLRNYTVTVSRLPISTNVDIQELTLGGPGGVSAGIVLDPPFNEAIHTYDLNAANNITDLRMAAIGGNAVAQDLTVNGVLLKSYTLESAQNHSRRAMAVCSHTDATQTELSCPLLEGGDTDVSILVTAEDGKTSLYNITAHRAPSTDCGLSNFTTTAGWDTSLPFDPSVVEYRWRVENSVTNMTVLANINHYGALLRINNALQTSGEASSIIDLLENGDTVTTAFVIAQDDLTHRTYTLTVARDPSHDPLLTGLNLVPGTLLLGDSGSLSLAPAFDSYIVSYTLSVPWTVSSLGFQLETSHPEATTTIQQRKHTAASPPVALLEGGDVTIIIQVNPNPDSKLQFMPPPHPNANEIAAIV